MPATIAFYDYLSTRIHVGPYLGAHVTLALACVKGLYGKQLKDVKAAGLKETQIRVSVGLEGQSELLEIFEEAIRRADEAKGEKAEQVVVSIA